jgi:hypothetical protein
VLRLAEELDRTAGPTVVILVLQIVGGLVGTLVLSAALWAVWLAWVILTAKPPAGQERPSVGRVRPQLGTSTDDLRRGGHSHSESGTSNRS